MHVRPGLCPNPAGEPYSAPPDLLDAFEPFSGEGMVGQKVECSIIANHSIPNKCIGDDTKAKLHLKNKKNKIWQKTIFNTAD